MNISDLIMLETYETFDNIRENVKHKSEKLSNLIVILYRNL